MRLLYFLVVHCLCISLNAHPVTESNSENTEPLAGGLSDADVNDPRIKNAAAFALNEIDRRQNSAFKQVLVQIVSAKTQVVAGTLYHLRLEVGASNCRKGKDSATAECTLKEESNNQICDVKVLEQLWLNNCEVIEVSCSTKTSRRKRETILGGLSDADVNEEGVKNAASFALTEVEKRSNSAYKQKLVKILSAKTQVVAGTLYHLQLEVGESSCEKGSNKAASECTLREGSNNQICDVKVLEQLWLNNREVTEVSCSTKTSRRKRETLVGGPADTDVNEEGVKSAANFALTEVEKRSNSIYKPTLFKILSAKQQVVAGTLYHLQLEVGESSCEKGSNKPDSECTLREGSNNQVCSVKVWDRPWLKAREVTEVDCSAKSQRRRRATIPGGLSDADVNQEGVKSAANFALTEVEKRSNSAYKQTLVKIMSAKTQVVAGTLYHLQLEVGETSCDKGSNKVASECTLREGSNNQVCSVKVWDRPWLKAREVTEVDCSAKSQRRRRAAPDITPRGGLSDANTNDVDIKSTAAFAVTEINNRQNAENKLVLVQILRAQSQIVEGSLYHLKLEIGERSCTNTNSGATSECTLKENSNNQVCDVKIWDRPWLNKREITEIQCSEKSDRRRRAVSTS